MTLKRRQGTNKGIFAWHEKRQQNRGPRIATMIILTIAGFLMGNVVLASKTSVPELTRAAGEITPLGHFLKVESPEAGIVSEVRVQEGQSLDAGQVLTVLISTTIEQSILEVEQKRAANEDRIYGTKKVLQLIKRGLGDGWRPVDQEVSNEYNYATSRIDLFLSQQEVQQNIIRHLEANLEVLRFASERAKIRLRKRTQKMADLKILFDRRLITGREFEDRQDKYEELENDALSADIKYAEALKAFKLAQAKLTENRLKLEEEYLELLFELEQTQAALGITLAAIVSRRDALVIRTSAAGTLHSIAFPNPGEVIEAGETLFEVLPRSQDLVAEIRIATNDIGHIKLGAPVSLKLDTYDPRRYGQISGHIAAISPKMLVDKATGEEYFRTTVTLNSETIGKGKWERSLRAGMATSAEIVTSERTIMAYLLKPIQRSFESAFGER